MDVQCIGTPQAARDARLSPQKRWAELRGFAPLRTQTDETVQQGRGRRKMWKRQGTRTRGRCCGEQRTSAAKRAEEAMARTRTNTKLGEEEERARIPDVPDVPALDRRQRGDGLDTTLTTVVVVQQRWMMMMMR